MSIKISQGASGGGGSPTGLAGGVLSGSYPSPLIAAGADLGTPSAIVLTNGTGTASGLTAGNVTTNANLTGDVTSVGNTATVASVAASTAANVHAAELIANAATDANTASAVVRRDASGNFSASAVAAKQVSDVIQAVGNSGATLTIDWSVGSIASITLNSNCTFTYSNKVAGQTLTLKLLQDVTGSRIVTWPTTLWSGGTAPTLTTTASKTDFITLFYDGTNVYGFVGGQNY